VVVDAAKVEARIDPRLYGQFLEFMYEGVKGGLSAELVRDRGFDGPPNSIGLSRPWERYPDDRIDDYDMSFHWDEGRIRVSLEEDRTGGAVLAEAAVTDIRGDWKGYAFVLRPGQSDPSARLAFVFEGKGRIWVDQVSLVPADAVGGIRADVEARVAALRPAFLR
jgi:hypothetical protein